MRSFQQSIDPLEHGFGPSQRRSPFPQLVLQDGIEIRRFGEFGSPAWVHGGATYGAQAGSVQ